MPPRATRRGEAPAARAFADLREAADAVVLEAARAADLVLERVRRVTGSTLYGLGSLEGKPVLVVDARPIGRVAIWRRAWTSDGVYKKAHQLKGSISNFGAARARSLAANVESLGADNKLDEDAALMPDPASAVDEPLVALRALTDELA